MPGGDQETILARHVADLQREFPGLRLGAKDDGSPVVKGTLGFRSTYQGWTVETEYDIEVIVPKDYPVTVPSAFETAGRIPPSFHKMDDGSLCLGAPLEVRMAFAGHSNLLGFVKQQIVPYLFSHAYWEQSGEMPFGDLRHGGAGILDSYRELLGVDDDLAALELLRMLADDSYHGHTLCPCGSGLRLRDCHGESVLTLKPHQSKTDFVYDHTAVLQHMCKQDPSLDAQRLASRRLKKHIRNIKRRPARRRS